MTRCLSPDTSFPWEGELVVTSFFFSPAYELILFPYLRFKGCSGASKCSFWYLNIHVNLLAVLMEEATTTTPTLWSGAVTESYQWTSMFQVNLCKYNIICNCKLN